MAAWLSTAQVSPMCGLGGIVATRVWNGSDQHHWRCGTGIGPDRDIIARWGHIAASCPSLPTALAAPARNTGGRARLLDGDSRIPARDQTVCWREMDSNFRFRARGAIDLSFSSVIYVPENVRFCRTNIRSRPRWRLLSSRTRTPNGRLATGGGRVSLSAALTSRE
jgi:hypothetical protein